MDTINLKPFNLQDALAGKAVMLRDGKKAYVRHHETVLPVTNHSRLTGFLADGIRLTWCENGDYYGEDKPSTADIIGMYKETRILNGFEVPVPETEALSKDTEYYVPAPARLNFYEARYWYNDVFDERALQRGVVFLTKEDAIATAQAMLGIDPNTGYEE